MRLYVRTLRLVAGAAASVAVVCYRTALRAEERLTERESVAVGP